MPRGFTYALYTTDLGVVYAKQVDRELAADPNRGWDTVTDPTGYPTWPLRAKPRMVYGVSPTTGRRNHAIVASITAALWIGTVNSFYAETSDPALTYDTYTVTRRRGESFPSPHASAPLP